MTRGGVDFNIDSQFLITTHIKLGLRVFGGSQIISFNFFVMKQALGISIINQLDFTDIKAKFQTKGWSIEQCEIVELWYKRFLTIKAKYPEQVLVPNKAIDEMWHAHILDTRRYARDCQAVFGYFLHHSPSYGKKDHSSNFNEMNRLYVLEFGEDCTQILALQASECTNCDDSGIFALAASECEDTDGGQSDQN